MADMEKGQEHLGWLSNRHLVHRYLIRLCIVASDSDSSHEALRQDVGGVHFGSDMGLVASWRSDMDGILIFVS